MLVYAFLFIYFVAFVFSQSQDDNAEDVDISDEESNESELDSDTEPNTEYEESEVESLTSDSDEEHKDEITNIKAVNNYSGWKSRTKINVYYPPEYIQAEHRTSNNYYAGTIKRKKGAKFDVYYSGTGNTDTINPTVAKWSYSDQDLYEWPHEEHIILEKNTLRPFQHKVERIGNWKGAKTCSTISLPLKVWSVPNSPFVHIGHIGVYECVTADADGTLYPHYGVPDADTQYFFGRRKTKDSTHFREFRPICRNIMA